MKTSMSVETRVKCAALEVALPYAIRQSKQRAGARAVRNVIQLANRISGRTLSHTEAHRLQDQVIALLAQEASLQEIARCVEAAYGLRSAAGHPLPAAASV